MENVNRILDTSEDISSKLGNIPEEIMQKDLYREKEIQNRKKSYMTCRRNLLELQK